MSKSSNNTVGQIQRDVSKKYHNAKTSTDGLCPYFDKEFGVTSSTDNRQIVRKNADFFEILRPNEKESFTISERSNLLYCHGKETVQAHQKRAQNMNRDKAKTGGEKIDCVSTCIGNKCQNDENEDNVDIFKRCTVRNDKSCKNQTENPLRSGENAVVNMGNKCDTSKFGKQNATRKKDEIKDEKHEMKAPDVVFKIKKPTQQPRSCELERTADNHCLDEPKSLIKIHISRSAIKGNKTSQSERAETAENDEKRNVRETLRQRYPTFIGVPKDHDADVQETKSKVHKIIITEKTKRKNVLGRRCKQNVELQSCKLRDEVLQSLGFKPFEDLEDVNCEKTTSSAALGELLHNIPHAQATQAQNDEGHKLGLNRVQTETSPREVPRYASYQLHPLNVGEIKTESNATRGEKIQQGGVEDAGASSQDVSEHKNERGATNVSYDKILKLLGNLLERNYDASTSRNEERTKRDDDDLANCKRLTNTSCDGNASTEVVFKNSRTASVASHLNAPRKDVTAKSSRSSQACRKSSMSSLIKSLFTCTRTNRDGEDLDETYLKQAALGASGTKLEASSKSVLSVCESSRALNACGVENHNAVSSACGAHGAQRKDVASACKSTLDEGVPIERNCRTVAENVKISVGVQVALKASNVEDKQVSTGPFQREMSVIVEEVSTQTHAIGDEYSDDDAGTSSSSCPELNTVITPRTARRAIWNVTESNVRTYQTLDSLRFQN